MANRIYFEVEFQEGIIRVQDNGDMPLNRPLSIEIFDKQNECLGKLTTSMSNNLYRLARRLDTLAEFYDERSDD